jgi:hypothetical protein
LKRFAANASLPRRRKPSVLIAGDGRRAIRVSLRIAFVHDLGASCAPQETIGCKPTMHFRFYLMIAALLLIGIEAAYSLYQLASFVL